jgi:hypothetical protein
LEKQNFEGALSEGIVIIQHQEAAIQGLSTVLWNATTNSVVECKKSIFTNIVTPT